MGTQGLEWSEEARRVTDWKRARRRERVELKGRQQWRQRQGAFSLPPGFGGMRVRIFESLRLEGSCVGDSL